MYLTALVDGLNVLAHLIDRVGNFKEVVLSDVDSRCQLRRHLTQLCADDVVLFHNTHTRTHAHTHKRINQPALHLKPLLVLNFASTASSGLHKLPMTMQCRQIDSSAPTPYNRLPEIRRAHQNHTIRCEKKN